MWRAICLKLLIYGCDYSDTCWRVSDFKEFLTPCFPYSYFQLFIFKPTNKKWSCNVEDTGRPTTPGMTQPSIKGSTSHHATIAPFETIPDAVSEADPLESRDSDHVPPGSRVRYHGFRWLHAINATIITKGMNCKKSTNK